MKDPLDRTKVVLRHLPPAISQSVLVDQIDSRYSGRYKWFCFRPGKTSQTRQLYSRAYIDFNGREDVVEFAEFFDGRIFVNEKGAQFKCIVEYAPSQRVPKACSRKDGREGTISKDPEYLDFLELLAKPVENLPSAEIQLERREAERAGAIKETPVVTPLMDFVRQKRAAKSGSQRSSSDGKLSRKAAGNSPGNARSASAKRGHEKKKVSTSMYVLRDSAKNAGGKDKATYILVPRRDDPQPSDKSISVVATSGLEKIDDQSVPSIDGPNGGEIEVVATGKRKILLLKGKEQGAALVSRVLPQQQGETSPAKNLPVSTSRLNPHREASARMIRSILSNKEARQSQSVAGQAVQQIESLDLEDKRTTRATTTRSIPKDSSNISHVTSSSNSEIKKASDDKVVGNGHHTNVHINEKKEKRTRNKDRPDRGFWTPLRRSDGLHVIDESLSTSTSVFTKLQSDSLEERTTAQDVVSSGVDVIEDIESSNRASFSGEKSQSSDIALNSTQLGRSGMSQSTDDVPLTHVEAKVDMPNASRVGQLKSHGSARTNFSSIENGSHRHGRRGQSHGGKDLDSFLVPIEGKPSKRGGATGHGSHEKQVWVQKSGSGS